MFKNVYLVSTPTGPQDARRSEPSDDSAAVRTGAAPAALGRRRAKAEAKISDIERGTRVFAVRRRLDELRRRPVAIEVRVRDTPVSDASAMARAGLERPKPEDVHTTICRQDYYTNHFALFNLLTASLPFEDWGRVEISGVEGHGLYVGSFELYPQYDNDYSEMGARDRCEFFLRVQILELLDWVDMLEAGPEPPDPDWCNFRWRVTLWRTRKLPAHV
jgi:hypothetical protein